jgi:hypothetical protein
VELVVHHSDGYAATLVPAMIEMGIDVWQGCFSTNDIPDLIKKYGGKISFMGGIENHLVDFEGWTEENNRYYIEKERLAENWLDHMREKKWNDMNKFVPAYLEACRRAGVKMVKVTYY